MKDDVRICDAHTFAGVTEQMSPTWSESYKIKKAAAQFVGNPGGSVCRQNVHATKTRSFSISVSTTITVVESSAASSATTATPP